MPLSPPPQARNEPVWMSIARAELGVRETPGKRSTPRVQTYFGATVAGDKTNDDVPWCSAFVNWVMAQAGFRGTRRLAARSWEHWGVASPARTGAIVVLWRESPESTKGHVGFLVSEAADTVTLLGGNQSNMVSIRTFPKVRVLTMRWPQMGV